jgi:hypothetical protein
MSSSEIAFLTANGKNDTHRKTWDDGTPNTRPGGGKPYSTVTWEQIRSLAKKPTAVPKDRAKFVVLSTYVEHDGRFERVQHDHGMYYGLAADIDEGNHSLETVVRVGQAVSGNTEAVFYSSSSATREDQRWRVAFLLAEGLPGADYSDTQQAMFSIFADYGIACCSSLTTTTQPIYLPNVPPDRRGADGKPLFYASRLIDGEPLRLTPDHPIIIRREAMRAKRAADEAAAEQRRIELQARTLKYVEATGDHFQPIEHFNENHRIDDLFMRYGFERKEGGRDTSDWKSPRSTSGSYSYRSYGDHWVCTSESANRDNVGRKSKGGKRCGDAFDLFVAFDHGGNRRAAIDAYRAEVRPSGKATTPSAAMVAEHHPSDQANDEGDSGERDDEAEVDVTELLGGPAERLPSGPDDPGPFPSHLLDVPGFIGNVAAYNLDTAYRKQPVLALAGALCLQGVIAGRKVRDRSGTRTNIYCMGLAPTGMGKDHARRINKQILYEAGLDQLEGAESVASHSAIESAVRDNPAILFQFDEFGRFLATLGDAQRSAHLFGIIDVLMKLFTSAGGVYRGKAYASRENNIGAINQPCAVLYGTTVEESFLRSLTRENVSDGLLSRMLIFEGERQPPMEYEAMEKPVPSVVLNVATYWRDFQSECNLENVNPEPIVVDTGREADLIFRNLVTLSDMEFGKGLPGCELWTRTLEKARKLALIYACSANHEKPVIDGLAALWASEVVQYMTRRMIFLADRWIADGRFDALQKEVVRKLEKRGGRVSRAEMCRVILRRVPSKQRDEVLRNMLETGQLRQHEVRSKTKPATFYEVA